jgi:tetratricopeptide (TPR) repeat protein
MKTLPLLLCLLCAIPAAAPTVLSAAETPSVSYDFGDQGSAVLTEKAWKAAAANDLAAVQAYTGRCIELYKQAALTQQASLKEPVPTANPEAVHAMWALNDVGTCYFILGQALEKAGQQAEAIKAYRTLVDSLAFAKCWDTKGWFWSPADAAKGRIKALEFDAAMM